MKNCKDIENNLPLYLDNLLSSSEKQAVEEHLKSCPQCSKALADLNKVGAMAQGLSEVEPPHWFKQKIMAKVREEADKKSFAQKWFYPLRIKIPVQVFATIFIVVLAVYIYRAGDEQFKEVMPPAATAPVLEEKKEQLTVKKGMPAKVAARSSKQEFEADKSCEGNACKVNETVMQDSIGKTMSAGKGKLEPRASAPPMPEKENVAEGVAPETKSRSLRATVEKTVSSVQLLQTKNTIIIRVSDIKTVAAQVEKILAEYNAEKVSKQSVDNKVVLSAEIKKEKLKDFIGKLKIIGPIEEQALPADGTEGEISIVIEILSN
ncbi:MAG: hypothetical protein A2031_04775 [Deltaproteobacteria bacterium RBG_19FT_COMBO_43_11]|nr:MAG: hypothetical protein A2031_04775 [Deltaproteobacteria bacterium RBG_19FT_COMBO_43_11]